MERAQRGLAFLKRVTTDLAEEPGENGVREPQSFDTTSITHLKEAYVEPGRCRCCIDVLPKLQNRFGTLHGGAIATIVDTVGTAALVTLSERSGVSLNINVNYLSPMPGGEEVVVDARVVKVGRAIATIEVDLHRKKTGALVARGTHVKFLSANEKPMEETVDLAAADLQFTKDALKAAAERKYKYLRSPSKVTARSKL